MNEYGNSFVITKDGVSLNSVSHPNAQRFTLWQRLKMFLFGSKFNPLTTEELEIRIIETKDVVAKNILDDCFGELLD